MDEKSLVPTTHDEPVTDAEETTDETTTDETTDESMDEAVTGDHTTETTDDVGQVNGLDKEGESAWQAERDEMRRELSKLRETLKTVSAGFKKEPEKQEAYFERTPMGKFVQSQEYGDAEKKAQAIRTASAIDSALAPLFGQIEEVLGTILKDQVRIADGLSKYQYSSFVSEFSDGDASFQKRFPKEKLDEIIRAKRADDYDSAAAIHAGASDPSYFRNALKKATEKGRQEGLAQRKMQTTGAPKSNGDNGTQASKLYIVNSDGTKRLDEDKVLAWKRGNDPVRKKIATDVYNKVMADYANGR